MTATETHQALLQIHSAIKAMQEQIELLAQAVSASNKSHAEGMSGLRVALSSFHDDFAVEREGNMVFHGEIHTRVRKLERQLAAE